MVNVGLFVPKFTPFTRHWYVGVGPAFVAVAVKVRLAPTHAGFVPLVRAIEMVGTTTELIVIVIPVDVSDVGLTQGAFEVRTHVTI